MIFCKLYSTQLFSILNYLHIHKVNGFDSIGFGIPVEYCLFFQNFDIYLINLKLEFYEN